MTSAFLLVHLTGIEPAHQRYQILNLARLPIPPYPRVKAIGKNEKASLFKLLLPTDIFYHKRMFLSIGKDIIS